MRRTVVLAAIGTVVLLSQLPASGEYSRLGLCRGEPPPGKGITGWAWPIKNCRQLNGYLNGGLVDPETCDPAIREACPDVFEPPGPPLLADPLDGSTSGWLRGGSFVTRDGATGFYSDRMGERISYDTGRYFDVNRGTVQFWIHIDWAGNDNLMHSLVLSTPHPDWPRRDHFQIGKAFFRDRNYIYASVWDADVVQHEINTYSASQGGGPLDIEQWRPNTWHHIAFTWSHHGHLALYLDGVRTHGHGRPWEPIDNVAPYLDVGSPDPSTVWGRIFGPSRAVFSDLVVYDYQRTEAEILADYYGGR